MIVVSAPIYTGTVNGAPLRFFRGPTDVPDFPWHAHEDLLAAFGLPRALRRRLRADMLRGFSKICRTVEVGGEPVLLAPHFVAQGLIEAAQVAGQGIARSPDVVARDYIAAGVEAMAALTASLTDIEGFAYAMEAFRNSGSREAGHAG